MIRATRREALMGGLALPAAAGLPKWRSHDSELSLLVYDAALQSGQRFAAAGRARSAEVLVVEGDRVRFARTVFDRKPALVSGVTRYVDALMIEDVGREAGYLPVAVLRRPALSRCIALDSEPAWPALCRVVDAAGEAWVEAFADFAAGPGQAASPADAPAASGPVDSGQLTAWVLAPKG